MRHQGLRSAVGRESFRPESNLGRHGVRGEYPTGKTVVSEPERPEPNLTRGPSARTGLARRMPQATKRVLGETVRLATQKEAPGKPEPVGH